jgi:hypothetical protein
MENCECEPKYDQKPEPVLLFYNLHTLEDAGGLLFLFLPIPFLGEVQSEGGMSFTSLSFVISRDIFLI